jgi:hypothetical protein
MVESQTPSTLARFLKPTIEETERVRMYCKGEGVGCVKLSRNVSCLNAQWQ